MCGHVFFYHDRHPLQRLRPVWQCGTCGRVSSVPADCCPHPDFGQHPPVGLTPVLGQWVTECGRWMRATVRPRWWWQRRPATRASTTPVTVSPHSVATAGVMISTADRDESPTEDDVMVAAGELR